MGRLVSDKSTIVKPKRAEPKRANKPSRRIILLSGTWHSPEQFFSLEATIFVTQEGDANGDILWVTVYAPSSPPGFKGSEFVGGWMRGAQLYLEGYYADPLLACDRYSIELLGTAKAGRFEGTSLTFGQGGKMAGTYDIVETQD
jgi:hypothetical protein